MSNLTPSAPDGAVKTAARTSNLPPPQQSQLAPSQRPERHWSAGRIIGVVIGTIAALIGLALLAAGASLTWATSTQRDSDGYFTSRTERFTTPTAAITAERIDLVTGARPNRNGFDFGDIVDVRIRAASRQDARAVFIGIARQADVDQFLRSVAHDEIRNVDFGPFRVRYNRQNGTETAPSPTSGTIWVVSALGVGRQEVVWSPGNDEWAIVVMHQDGSPGVDVDLSAGARVRYLWPIVFGLFAGALFFGLGGAALVIGSAPKRGRGGPGHEATPATATAPIATATRPTEFPGAVQLNGSLDPNVSSWMWLVKWILAIPHFIALAVLWTLNIIGTIFAGFAILFTGRYPRALFDFSVGVLRWTWRVGFYATSALGTDCYPPFRLSAQPGDFATFDVRYPETLSRGLVLVKWWLLAIPHYIIVGIIGTGWWRGNWSFAVGPWRLNNVGFVGQGLLGVLLLVAAVRLLVTGRYPRDMFDLIIGLNRWGYRVAGYALLLTDEYPPFRLDQGSTAPALTDRRDDG